MTTTPASSCAGVGVFAQCGDDRYDNVDKMVLRGAEALPHGLINNVSEKVGPDGELLLDYVRWVRERVFRLRRDPSYEPLVHLDVYGTLGIAFGGDICHGRAAADARGAQSASRARVKFLVDAHLPPSLARLLAGAGHDVIHTLDLAGKNHTSDALLNDISVRDERVVITKDTDFFYSHVLHGRPWKLLLVRTGNIGAGDLRLLFERHLSDIEAALTSHTLVEIDRHAVMPLR